MPTDVPQSDEARMGMLRECVLYVVKKGTMPMDVQYVVKKGTMPMDVQQSVR